MGAARAEAGGPATGRTEGEKRMVLQLFVLMFTLAVTFIQSIFGMFSGVIMCFCSVVSAAVALGFHEPLADFLSGGPLSGVDPSYVSPSCLILLFVLTLLLLRTAADNLIRGNVRVPLYMDWAGGGVLGFITAQVCIGTLAMGFLMLPFGGQAGMYKRYIKSEEPTDTRKATFARSDLWLNPDGFTFWLVDQLSGGSLSGTTRISSVYPDFPEWVWFSGNTVQSESLAAPSRDQGDGYRGIRVVASWEQKSPVEARYRTVAPTRERPAGQYVPDNYSPASGHRLIGMRLKLDKSSGDRSDRSVKHRFRPTMLRVVGVEDDRPAHYVARVITNADERIGGKARVADLDSNFCVGDEAELDVYFEVGEGFQPRFVEYRRYARAAVDAAALAKASGPPSGALASAGGGGGETSSGGGPGEGSSGTASGVMRFIDAIVQPSGDYDKMPVMLDLAKVRNAGVEIADGRFVSGRVSGDFESLRQVGNSPGIEYFKIPEGKRICQIRYHPKKAHSLAGQVFNYVARTLNQYSAQDDTGDRHMLAGYYAIVKRDGRQVLEIFYEPNPTETGARGMLDFQFIQPSELTADEDAELGLLFNVPYGRTVTAVVNQTGQGVRDLNFRVNSSP